MSRLEKRLLVGATALALLALLATPAAIRSEVGMTLSPIDGGCYLPGDPDTPEIERNVERGVAASGADS